MPDWSGETCVIVASGPSAKDVPLEIAKGRARFIAINNSLALAPWADVLYGCDYAWWKFHKGCPAFAGLKICGDERAAGERWGVHFEKVSAGDDRLETQDPSKVGSGSNSGFQALNLAAHFHCDPIVLAGFDMRIDHGFHWHGNHPSGLANPERNIVGRWRQAIDGAAPTFKILGVRVINCSPVSLLTAYPKMSLAEAFP